MRHARESVNAHMVYDTASNCSELELEPGFQFGSTEKSNRKPRPVWFGRSAEPPRSGSTWPSTVFNNDVCVVVASFLNTQDDAEPRGAQHQGIFHFIIIPTHSNIPCRCIALSESCSLTTHHGTTPPTHPGITRTTTGPPTSALDTSNGCDGDSDLAQYARTHNTQRTTRSTTK